MPITVKSFFLICLSFFTVPLSAQQNLITCSHEQNADRSVSIYADSRAEGEYTLKMIFPSLLGYTASIHSDLALVSIYNGRREIARLTPVNTASMFSFNYRYQYFAGASLRKRPDTAFVYLLPANEGAGLRISKVRSLAEGIGQKTTDELFSTGFIYQKTDTICAARSGTVTEVFDGIKEGEKNMDFYRKERNHIRVQQKDGTLASYSVLAPIQLLVSTGENVVPGQPLAIFTKESEKYMVLFAVYYLDEKKLLIDKTVDVVPTGTALPYVYLPTVFYQSETSKAEVLLLNKRYTATHPKEMVALELSKKDKKKLGL